MRTRQAEYCLGGTNKILRMPNRKQNIDLNRVLADNLEYFMKDKKFSQNSLAKASGVPQTTIGLLLHPEKREPRKSGKQPSPTIAQLQILADKMGIQAWELLWPLNHSQREMYVNLQSAMKGLTAGKETVK